MTSMATIKLICRCGVSETKYPIFQAIHMRVLPILTDFMAFSALPPLSNRQTSTFVSHLFFLIKKTKQTTTKQKNPPKTENKELKLPGGDINHEPSTHLK